MSKSNSTQNSGDALILLVNGTANGRTARKAVLEEQGHRVVVSSNGTDAMEQCLKHKFDLVVTDDKLQKDERSQKMDGMELIVCLAKHNPALPVILISGLVETLGHNEQNTGASAVIQKSANEVTHLIRAVNRILRLSVHKKPAVSERPRLKSKSKGSGG
jgi:CheY-like chemotaxis protein